MRYTTPGDIERYRQTKAEIARRKEAMMKELRERKMDAKEAFYEAQRADRLAWIAKEKARKEERINKMASLYKEGKTLEEVGAEFGLTRERVRQILEKAGIQRRVAGERTKPEEVEERTCPECGELFVVPLGSNRLFCTKECSYKGKGPLLILMGKSSLTEAQTRRLRELKEEGRMKEHHRMRQLLRNIRVNHTIPRRIPDFMKDVLDIPTRETVGYNWPRLRQNDAPCFIEGCEKKAHSLGMCKSHYDKDRLKRGLKKRGKA